MKDMGRHGDIGETHGDMEYNGETCRHEGHMGIRFGEHGRTWKGGHK